MRWEDTAALCQLHVSEESNAESGGEQGNADVGAKSDEPVGVFGPVMMFLACLLALGVSHPSLRLKFSNKNMP